MSIALHALAGLMLRLGRRGLRPEPAPDDARRANHDAGADIHGRERQQHRLRIVPDQIR